MSTDELHPDDRARIARRRRSRVRRLADAEATFRQWLHLPDVGALHVALGTVAANRIEGDPAWLLLVGAPSSGKTEVVGAFARLDYVHSAATLTEAGLLSGSPKREHATDATGGLLHTMGAFGVLLTKDFGSVLSMHRDEQARVLAALREVYDGSWTRLLGVDGGKTLHWRGKCGFLGGCTPTIDRAHGVMGALGERFLLYRVELDDPAAEGRRRVANRGHERRMREELDQAVEGVLDGINRSTKAADLDPAEAEWLVRWATFAVAARTAVERDGYRRDVELMPEREGPARLVGQLAQMSAGLGAIGVDDDRRWRLLGKLAADSMPALRRVVLDALADAEGPLRQSSLLGRTRIPRTTATRTLEDLLLLGMVESAHPNGSEPWWSLTAFARSTWPDAKPEPVPRCRDTPPSKELHTPRHPHLGTRGGLMPTYETYDLRGPRPPRQTRNVRVRWRATRAGVSLVCECGWASPPTAELHDHNHARRLAEHIDFAHDPSSNPRRNP